MPANNNSVFSTMWDYISNSFAPEKNCDRSEKKSKMGDHDQDMAKGGLDWSSYSSAPPHELEKNHSLSKQEKSWFQVQDSCHDYPSQYPYSHNQELGFMSPPPFQHQIAFNITENCYESLPVTQGHPFLNSFKIDINQQTEDIVGPQEFLENVIEIVEDQLVQFVCTQSSAVSPHRLAAETLAKSNLNPNADEFKPRESDEDSSKIIAVNCDRLSSDDENNLEMSKSNASICDKIIVDPGDSCHDSDTDDDNYEDEEDSDWWDSDDDSPPCCVEISPSEFEDLFPTGLLVTKLLPHCRETKSDSSSIENQRGSSVTLKQETKCEYSNVLSESLARTGKCVRFCNDAENLIIEEPEELSEDLAKARQGDFQQRQADKERMERLLAPILSVVHRAKVLTQRTVEEM